VVHGVHDAPHCVTLVSSAQALPHLWNPLSHVKLHETPSHVAVALSGGAHGVHDEPHELVLVFGAH
jgi:hypothetical protein